MPDDSKQAITSRQEIVEELESITDLLDEIEAGCVNSDNIPILDNVIEDNATVTTPTSHNMVAQSLFPEDSEEDIPVLTEACITDVKKDEEQLVLPPVEELDAELAEDSPPETLTDLPAEQWIEDAVQQCLSELEPLIREKITAKIEQLQAKKSK